MKHLSFILALMVLVLSTLPGFMEDKCFDVIHQTTNSQEQDSDDCGMECCSPFSKCNTCTGFVITSFYALTTNYVQQPKKKLGVITASAVSDFLSSIWQPPKIN
ncbi:hypothetical protein HP439_17685 [Sphingobacterium shayense]|uniref:hypothetical protein n=1 Tax=Sphingobacterium shayense TaxID=626343 RepID=UPI001554F97A|nr:hypothetical protein [Sphingobacterium shayense]NQD72559.1 hypothetical protein [Sphingobacterium shayense]